MSTPSPIERLRDWAGGTNSAIARKLKVTRATVSDWAANGIPPARAIQVERMSGGALRAVDLCPSAADIAAA